MSLDWYPGIREACAYWHVAPTLQHTFAAMESAMAAESDAVIDAAKCVVEVVCRIIVDELDSAERPAKPPGEHPSFGEWVAAAVRVLSLGDNRNKKFQKLVSQHSKLTTTLGDLRNAAGPVSHGRDAFLERLSAHHRRSAVLAADALVTFLFQAYLEAVSDFVRTREPYDRFARMNALIDQYTSMTAQADEDGVLEVSVRLASGDEIPVRVEPSRLLYQLDRDAYVEALNAARDAAAMASPEDGDEADEVAA